MQVLLVAWTWLIAVPLGTCWMWRLSFVASLEGALTMLASRMHPVYFVSDCLQVRHCPVGMCIFFQFLLRCIALQ